MIAGDRTTSHFAETPAIENRQAPSALEPILQCSACIAAIKKVGSEPTVKDTTGLVLEAEYFTSPNLGIKIRGVKEEYKTETGNQKFSGNHIGVFANYYF